MYSLALIFVMFAGSLSAGEFNSREIRNQASTGNYEKVMVEMLPERPAEEAEIDDIPFNTVRIAEQAGIDLRALLPAEDDINDIPFNTAEIARKYGKKL